jgi:polysaccharide export outer membrane protein
VFSTSLLITNICFATSEFVPREPRYRLHPGDVITIEYRYTPEYNAIVSVEPDGFVSLPLVGDIKVGGLTLSQAHSQLMTKATERLNDPEIVIGLKEFDNPHYTVGGEVRTPGRFDLRGRITILQAIAIAGGFNGSAKSSQILLIRPVDQTKAETRIIDLKRVIDKRDLSEDVELHSGDMLVVPKTRLSKVEPYVRLVNAGLYLNPLSF